ncbi:MAG: c-type cytochrome [Gammaproteobacteria bacterium]|nr:c-type cytochrome [Gammaproteobacteria bacterium]
MYSKTLAPLLASLFFATGAQAADKKGVDVYKSACAACHATGAAGAPKLGDKTAWGKRFEAGLPTMIKIAIKGKRAMPPKGGQSALSDMEVARAVVHMANAGGGKFKEPKAAEIAEAIK